MAEVAIAQGRLEENTVVDVTGPETFRYKDYIRHMVKAMGLKRAILPMPPMFGWLFGRVLGVFLRDDVITRAEIKGLRQGLMASDAAPVGTRRFSTWIAEHGASFGERYQNDLKERRYKQP